MAHPRRYYAQMEPLMNVHVMIPQDEGLALLMILKEKCGFRDAGHGLAALVRDNDEATVLWTRPEEVEGNDR